MNHNLTIVLIKSLNHFNVLVKKETLESRIRSHPNYPTLKSLCDTLEEFGISTYPAKVKTEQLKEIDGCFIAHLKNGKEENCAFILNINSEKVQYYSTSQKIQTISREGFEKTFTGIVVLIEKSQDFTPKKFTSEKDTTSFLLYSLTFLFALAFFYLSIINASVIFSSTERASIFITKILGLALTSVLVYKDWTSNKDFASKVCKMGKSVDCDSVLSSKYSRLYQWIKWSDIGFIYFSSTLLVFLTKPESISEIKILALMALPYLFISVYQQAVLIKKWCVFCLTTLVIILIEGSIALLFSPSIPSSNLFTTTLPYILFFSIAYLLAKQAWLNKINLKEEGLKLSRFKRNPDIFNLLWQKEKSIQINYSQYDILVGNVSLEADTLTVFISLTCSYCKESFLSLRHIMDEHPRLRIHVIPVMSQTDNQQLGFMKLLSATLKNAGDQASFNLLEDWYKHKFKPSNEDGNPENLSPEEKAFISTNFLNLRQNGIEGLPAYFINQKSIPEEYKLTEALDLHPLPKLSKLTQPEMII